MKTKQKRIELYLENILNILKNSLVVKYLLPNFVSSKRADLKKIYIGVF